MNTEIKAKVGKLIYQANKDYQKEYYRKHRDIILEQRHKAYADNPGVFAERNRVNYQKRKAAKNERGQ